MTKIALDCSKLLGFKIIADGAATKLCSPKIGAKGCGAIAGMDAAAVKAVTLK